MFLLQGSILFKGPIPLLPSVTALVELLLRTSRHVINVAGYQVIIVNDPEFQSPITMLLRRLKVCPCVRSLEDCNYLVPYQKSIGNEKVSECTYFFRVSFKHRMPTENSSRRNHLFVVCKVLAYITVVCGIICVNQSYQIIPQLIDDGLSIYSVKSSCVLF